MDCIVNLYVTGLVVQMKKNVDLIFSNFVLKKRSFLLKIHPNNTIGGLSKLTR